MFEHFLLSVVEFTGWLWGWPMILILAGGSLLMTAYLGFFQFRYFPYIMKQTFGHLFEKPKEGEKGTISGFKAMLAALGATIGAGNIVGAGVAIGMGGPGALFWMWICGIMASAFKYAEIVLGIKYRIVDENGEYTGGPMYYLRKITPWLGSLYAVIFVLELIPSVANQAASVTDIGTVAGIPKAASAVVIAVIILAVVWGGIRRIADVMNAVVPFMSVAYFVGVLVIVAMNITKLPEVVSLIFKCAFTGHAATGGFAGSTLAITIRWGLARGVGSNDAGNGQSAIAHASAITDHPARQGMWGIFEVVLDTLVICTLTGLAILITDAWKVTDSSMASTLAAVAFQSVMGNMGAIFVNIITALFCITTIVVIIYYGERLAIYLFGKNIGRFAPVFYTIASVLGAFGSVDVLINFLDIMYAGMIIPNVIGLFIMRKEIKEQTDDFFLHERFK